MSHFDPFFEVFEWIYAPPSYPFYCIHIDSQRRRCSVNIGMEDLVTAQSILFSSECQPSVLSEAIPHLFCPTHLGSKIVRHYVDMLMQTKYMREGHQPPSGDEVYYPETEHLSRHERRRPHLPHHSASAPIGSFPISGVTSPVSSTSSRNRPPRTARTISQPLLNDQAPGYFTYSNVQRVDDPIVEIVSLDESPDLETPPVAMSPVEAYALPGETFEIAISSPQAIDNRLFHQMRVKYKMPDGSITGKPSHEGLLYVFQVAGSKLFKIGRTAQRLPTRKAAISNNCQLDLLVVSQSPIFKYLKRAESLAHTELSNFVRHPGCHHPTHKEYFRVSEEVAVRTMKRWAKFLSQSPYDSKGFLKDFWNDRLRRLPPPPERETVDDHDARHKRWEKFVSPSHLDHGLYWWRLAKPTLLKASGPVGNALHLLKIPLIVVAVLIYFASNVQKIVRELALTAAGAFAVLAFLVGFACLLSYLTKNVKVRVRIREEPVVYYEDGGVRYVY